MVIPDFLKRMVTVSIMMKTARKGNAF